MYTERKKLEFCQEKESVEWIDNAWKTKNVRRENKNKKWILINIMRRKNEIYILCDDLSWIFWWNIFWILKIC